MIRVFCAGETRAKTVVRSATCAERRVRHRVELLAEHDAARLEADLRAHVAGDQLVVPGQDLDGDPVAPEGLQRLADARRRADREGHEADERELALVADRVRGLPGQARGSATASTR